MRRLLSGLLVAVAFAAACKTTPTRPPVTPGPDRTAEFMATCTDVYQTYLHRTPDPSGLTGCINQARAGRTKDDLIAWIKDSDEYKALNSFHPLPPITVDGLVFRVNGQPWVWKGFSSFRLMDRWVRGEDITPVLNAYHGFNIITVFVYTPANVWGAKSWPAPTPDQVVAFVRDMNKRGWYVELVLLTSAGDQYVATAKSILSALAPVYSTSASNVVIRLGNEPEQQNGPGNPPYETLPLRAAVEATPFIYDSGFYAGGGRKWFGMPNRSYISPHTKRDPEEWMRRAHDCYDLHNPPRDSPPGAQKISAPCIMGEPGKPGTLGPIAQMALDFRGYMGSAVLMGSGGDCHTETGLQGLPPTNAELQVCASGLIGLSAFPGNAVNGAYRCLTCPGGGGDSALRTYSSGDRYMVRIRPTSPNAPPGWRSLDPDHILYSR